jgi:hypothetical protein
MEPGIPTINGRDDEISLKDVILTLREWWRYLLHKWVIILVFGLVGAALGLTTSLMKKPHYAGELTFILEDSKSSPLGSYAGLASQFGLDLGGGGSMGVFSGDNILEFLMSRFIVERTLLSPVNVDNKIMSLADLYMNVNHYRGDPKLQQVSFPANADRATFSRLQDSVLNILYEKITHTELVIEKPDKKLDFISVVCTSSSEIFSKVFVEQLVKEATDFYVATKTKRSRANVNVLQAKADSLQRLMTQKAYTAAVQEDLNQNPVRRMASVGTELASRDKLVLQTVYGEVVKNLELSRMSMSQETPVIQIVDTPIFPLKVVRLGKLKGLLLGGILGGFLVVLVLLARKIFGDIVR